MTDETLPSEPTPHEPAPKASAILRVSHALRCTPATAKKKLLNNEDGLSYEAAEIIRALNRGDHTAERERFWAPLIAAYEDRPAPRSLKQLRHKAQVADSSEDLAESLVMDSESPANLRRWARELRDEASLGLELAASAEARAKELEEKAAGGSGA